MRSFFLSSLLLGLCLSGPSAFAADGWGTDYKKALEQARKENKPLLVKFSATWCGTCVEMAKGPLSKKTVNDALKQVVTVALDVDKNKALTKQYRVEGLPTLLFMTPNGVIFDRTEQFVAEPKLVERLNQAKHRSQAKDKEFKALKEAVEKDRSAASRNALATFLEKRGNLLQASRAYRQVLENADYGSGVRQKAGVRACNALILIERFSEAIKISAEVVEVDDSDPLAAHALFLKGYAQETAGKKAEARKSYAFVAKQYASTRAGKLAAKRVKALSGE